MINDLIMTRIIYKDGCDGQKRLECIEGIEIDLLNGQRALIYPRYSNEALLEDKDRSKWKAGSVFEIEALRLRDNTESTASRASGGVQKHDG